jgi:hypothetical protein
VGDAAGALVTALHDAARRGAQGEGFLDLVEKFGREFAAERWIKQELGGDERVQVSANSDREGSGIMIRPAIEYEAARFVYQNYEAGEPYN